MNRKQFSTILEGYNMNILRDLRIPYVSNHLTDSNIQDDDFLMDLLMYSSDTKFMKRKYEGVLSDLNQDILDHQQEIISHFKDVDSYKSLRYLFGRDFCICGSVDRFMKYKQVYEVDKDFIHDLVRTQSETSTVPLNVFKHLPYNSFYIDLETADICKYIYGCFISVRTSKENLEICAEVIGKSVEKHKDESDGYFGSHMCRVSLDLVSDTTYASDDIDIGIDSYALDDVTRDEKFKTVLDKILEIIHDNLPGSSNWDFSFMWYVIVPFLIYLNSYQPDIKLRKSYNKKTNSVFKDIQTNEVGFTYGCSIRKSKLNSRKTKYIKSTKEPEDVKSYSRRGHMRRAHWHKFRYGKGRENVKLLWMPPMYISGTDNQSITMHKVN